MSVLRKVMTAAGAKQLRQASDADVAQMFPGLVEMLSVVQWPEGDAREPGTLLLCSGDGRWRMWLNDKDNLQSCWVSGESITACLDALERGLQEGNLEWRSDIRKSRR